MGNLVESIQEQIHPRKMRWRIFFTILTLAIAMIGLLFLFSFVYQKAYTGKVYWGVKIDNYELGGMTEKEVKGFLEGLNNRYSKEGLDLVTRDEKGKEQKFKLNTIIGGDDTIELVSLDSDKLINLVMQIGRPQTVWGQLWQPLYLLILTPARLDVPLKINEKVLKDELKSLLGFLEDEPQNANIIFLPSNGVVKIVPERSGLIFDYERIIRQIKKNLAILSFQPINISLVEFKPKILQADAEKMRAEVEKVFAYGGLGLNYVDNQTNVRYDWNLDNDNLARYLELQKSNDGVLFFGLNKEKVLKYLETVVREEIDIPAHNARFAMKDDKVEEFSASQNGITLDKEQTFVALERAFKERNYHPAEAIKTVGVVVAIVEPEIKTSNVNNFGITGILGAGVSSFRNSHVRRIQNITNAIKRLNGYLVKPGEEFSALKAVGPFTEENGFVKELVIKGKEIKEEVGGGMCQIGTTLFRMAMNSGMPITERRNHSLVVDYYADPVNGNPGTDATLYEPILDLKFLNDTENYLLVLAEADYKKMQLKFTLWGKPDGRSGSYTHPIVSKWIPPGDPQETIVNDLTKVKPGEKKCQNAYKGAVASFVYTRFTSTTEKIEQTFDSYYRPLPQICMWGATTTVPVAGDVNITGKVLDTTVLSSEE